MKQKSLIVLIISALLSGYSCMEKKDSEKKEIIMRRAIAAAENHIYKHLADAEKTVSDENAFIYRKDQNSYVLRPENIFTGTIISGRKDDAIISLEKYFDDHQLTSELLIIVHSGDTFSVERVFESDMKIIEIDDSVIIADVPEHSRNSPLFNCSGCREIVRFVYRDGDLRRIE